MNTILFIAAILATWRVAHMLMDEAAPFNLLGRLRNALYANKALRDRQHGRMHAYKPGGVEDLFTCFLCMSIWAAFPFALWLGWGSIVNVIVYDLALSAGAIFLNYWRQGKGF